MQKYLEAYNEAIRSGTADEGLIRKHVGQQQVIDTFLPDAASFFYIVEPPSRKYHFMGKLQESVTGYPNEEFLNKGLELFLQCLHPEEIDIILNQIYPDFSSAMAGMGIEEIKKLQFQYNYRFRIKSGTYRNLLEQTYVLEIDENGIPSLFLGNIIVLDDEKVLPLRSSIKVLRKNGVTETIFSKTYNRNNSVLHMITSRELDILRNLAAGKTSREIGQELFISPHTVDTHRRNLLKKLGCKTVVELARIAFQNALL